MAIRSYASVEILLGDALSFHVKLYAVAAERKASFSSVHAGCESELEQQYVCRGEGVVVPRGAMSRRYTLEDGRTTVLSEDELKGAESVHVGSLELVEFVEIGSLDPAILGKAVLLGPEEGSKGKNIDGYSHFVDALSRTRTAAIGVHYTRTRDQLVTIEPYRGRGLLLREIFHGSELRPIDEVELPPPIHSSARPGVLQLWTNAIEKRRAQAGLAEHVDGYPARVEAVAREKLNGTANVEIRLVRAARDRLVRSTGGSPPATDRRSEPASVHRAPVTAPADERPSESMKAGG